MKIILAHGVLGFDAVGPIEYFKGVAAYLEETFPDVKVATSRVDAVGRVATRAPVLAEFIAREAREEPDGVCVFAHSMGGLDTRYALHRNLSEVREHIATVVMIGTPHLGSPVADGIERVGSAAWALIPAPIRRHLTQAALHDLTTAVATAADAEMEDVPGIEYVHVAGDITQEGARASHAFRAISDFFSVDDPSDCVVTKTSAVTRHGVRQPAIVWPTDHAAEVGWNFDALVHLPGLPHPSADQSHLPRYKELVRKYVIKKPDDRFVDPTDGEYPLQSP